MQQYEEHKFRSNDSNIELRVYPNFIATFKNGVMYRSILLKPNQINDRLLDVLRDIVYSSKDFVVSNFSFYIDGLFLQDFRVWDNKPKVTKNEAKAWHMSKSDAEYFVKEFSSLNGLLVYTKMNNTLFSLYKVDSKVLVRHVTIINEEVL